MLYDPKWEVKTKPDVFSPASLIAWLETQPAEAQYCFLDTGGCLFFKYLAAMGVAVHSVGGEYYRLEPCGDEIYFPEIFQNIAALSPHTFGAALERARAVALSL